MTIDYGDAGERVVGPGDGGLFYAHLSLYELAAPFMQGARVLDAGCGTGYGCAHLVKKGAASVIGIDASPKAIDYCRVNYAGPNLDYTIADLNGTLPGADQSFSAIFSSNAMEHIAQIDAFLSEVFRVLTKDGVFFAAVPAITTISVAEDNFRNAYHLTNLTPRCWHRKISRYFAQVRMFRHWARDPSGDWSAFRETDFLIEECDIETANSTQHIANAVFVATMPLAIVQPPTVEEHILTIVHAEMQASRADASRLQTTLEAVYGSRSWRLTAPLRAAARYGLEFCRRRRP